MVLHYTAMRSFEEARARLCDPRHEVSAHWLLAEDGRALPLVPEERRAWHAGAGAWGEVRDVNSRSVGIELCNTGAHPFPWPQMAALETLLAGVLARWAIPPERVVGHSDMAPARKSDPGPRFDWRALALGGLSVWPGQGTPGDLGADLAAFGYLGGATDVLRAFRLRFFPGAAGPVTPAERAAAADLAARYPVDRARPRA